MQNEVCLVEQCRDLSAYQISSVRCRPIPCVSPPFHHRPGQSRRQRDEFVPSSTTLFSSGDEFFERPEAEMILDQCAVKQFHRLDGMDDHWADEFGLNHAQMRYVQQALPGNERAGYSEALVGIDGEWRGVEVRALPDETTVIEGDVVTGPWSQEDRAEQGAFDTERVSFAR
jgi:hypothetical protein